MRAALQESHVVTKLALTHTRLSVIKRVRPKNSRASSVASSHVRLSTVKEVFPPPLLTITDLFVG